MPSKKRKRDRERATIHPRNRYAENPPDFELLASLYPSFMPFVFYSSRDGRPRIDWTDYNATRELTKVLLLHDHGLKWWIPDGQLCPTVPNRSNYIHWIEDLLLSDIIPSNRVDGDAVWGFDIGTGANCIYPLLGASLLGWNFVGSDITDVALEWAEKNVKNNPQISELVEIRRTDNDEKDFLDSHKKGSPSDVDLSKSSLEISKIRQSTSCLSQSQSCVKKYHGPPILLGVIKDEEKFDFCMCNPPFFEAMDEAGLNPKTACGGTSEEMVCPGGEQAFVIRIIEDSAKLRHSFRWYTSMVGRKSNLKFLISKLRDVGVTIVKTTEFVQGQTCRWGLAWSFFPPSKKIASSHVTEQKNLSFMLEGLQRQCSAIHVLQSVESFFSSKGASCKLDAGSFTVDIIASEDHCQVIVNAETQNMHGTGMCQEESGKSDHSSGLNCHNLHLTISVFQQIPGTLLVRGSLKPRDGPGTGQFHLLFQQLEGILRSQFCKVKAAAEHILSEQKR